MLPKKISNDYVEFFEVDTEKSISFKTVLTDAAVLINIAGMGWDAPIKAAQDLKIPLKLYIGPNYGGELDKIDFVKIVPDLDGKFQHNQYWRTQGFKVIDLMTSIFVIEGGFNTDDLVMFNHDKDQNTVERFGDKDTLFDISYIQDVAWVVGSIIRKGAEIDFNTLPNRILVSSDKISQEDVFKRYENSHGIQLKRITTSKEQSMNEAIERAKAGFSWFDIWYYVHVFIGQGKNGGLYFEHTDNEYINPKEVYFKWTKYH
ncbi:hypothetical protein DAMA08_044000 [Martiniozyma asiatica (nom. inval.)]|nr:hypothetical protein DAMA08_044000 [Martiniozyma asiatica]